MNNPFLGVVRNEMQAGNYWSGVGVRVESSLRETAGHGEEVPYGKQVLRTECKGEVGTGQRFGKLCMRVIMKQ